MGVDGGKVGWYLSQSIMFEFNKKNSITFIWFVMGVAFPMFVGLFKNTIFTRIFTAKEYGEYALVNITFSYATIFFITWISGIVWRFYQRFKFRDELDVFYSNVFFLYTISFFILLFFTILYLIFQSEAIYIELIIYTFLFYISKEIVMLIGIILRLNQNDKFYNIIKIVQSLFGFGILFLLVFSLNFRIESFFLSSFLIDIVIIVFFIYKNHSIITFRFFSIQIQKEFLHFGGKTIIISLLLLGIVSSDRYIISYYDTIEHVGIYNQLYKFSELSIGAVIMVLYGFINPILTVKFEKNLIKSDKLILKYFVMISLISIPIIVILSVFAKPISAILFHESFAKYYYLIPFILISAYLYGLVNLIELKLKFENKMNIIILFYSICLIMNIILNVFFIPKYGFQFAALSTLITYIIMLVFFYWYYMLKVKLQ